MKKIFLLSIACCLSFAALAQNADSLARNAERAQYEAARAQYETARTQHQKEMRAAMAEARLVMKDVHKEVQQAFAELRQEFQENFEGDWLALNARVSTSQPTVKDERKVGTFTRLDISSAFVVELKKGPKHELVIECQEKYLPYIKTEVRAGELNIYIDSKVLPKLRSIEGPLRAYITMPELQSVELSGACRLTTRDAFSSDKFSADLSGASSIKGLSIKAKEGMIETSGASSVQMNVSFDRATIDISGVSSSTLTGDIKKLSIELSGASKIEYSGQSEQVACDLSGTSRLILKGSATILHCEASGASSMDASTFKVQTAHIDASGGSRLSVSATESIQPSLSGASRLNVIGQPQITNRSLSSGASIHFAN
jgi:Protein of unknown function (DUF2807).